MHVRLACLGGALVIAAGVAFGPAPARGEEKSKAGAADLSGHWRLNKELSDKDQTKYIPKSVEGAAASEEAADGSGGGRRSGRGGTRGGTSRPPIPGGADDDPRGAQRAAGPAEEMTITQTEPEIVVEEKPGRPRAFYPNGKAYKADDGASDVKSTWSDGGLVVEKKNVRGWKLTETWRLAPDRKRLTVDLRLEGGSRPKVATRRVYDRVEP
jgi:hypothetical protein